MNSAKCIFISLLVICLSGVATKNDDDLHDENLDASTYSVHKFSKEKIEQDIARKRVFQEENAAENNAPFIFDIIGKLSPNYKVVENIKNKDEYPKGFGGVYMMYFEQNLKKYPVYVGSTEKSFNERFSCPITNEVKFNKAKELVNTNGMDLKVILIPVAPKLNIGQSKLWESFFLEAFDFCLNKLENGNFRHHLLTNRPQHGVAESKTYFFHKIDPVMMAIKESYLRTMQ